MRNKGLSRAKIAAFIGVGLVGGGMGACSSSSSDTKSGPGTPHTDSGVPSGSGGSPGIIIPRDAGYFDIEAGTGAVVITPGNLEVTVDPTKPIEPVQYSARGIAGRHTTWRVTNPSLGYIDDNGRFVPSGRIGGEADIQIMEGGRVVASVHLVVNLVRAQNGGGAEHEDAGIGGLGGVGGDGLGVALADDVAKALSGAPSADSLLAFVYPYDETVFPLGVLPPLLQWTSGSPSDVDGVAIHITAPHFDYRGVFGRPAALAPDKPLQHHPIPRDVWDAATLTAAGGTLKVELVLSVKGKPVGPVSQQYRIALAPFRGVIYYQSYGTSLVKNYYADWGGQTGGATLSIRAGDEAPKLVAGKDSSDHTGCRVCHSVSARGDAMVVQHGDQYLDSSRYDLNSGNAESNPFQPGSVGWAGLTPDGLLGLANSVTVNGFPTSNLGDTALYDMTTGAAVPSPGLTEFVKKSLLPAFSPDSRRVVFGLIEGTSTPEIGPAKGQLVTMDFDAAARAFSNPQKLWEPQDGQATFSTFMPDGRHVVAQRRWAGENNLSSANGARSDLWWIDLDTRTPTRLDRLNGLAKDGTAYVPRGPNAHDKDEELSYEPSISPVAAGGYAWVVFMSRRLYGNVATRDPYESNSVQRDLSDSPTTKKIWMAAIDLDARPGEDPSHPAFYIPGQELYGVNSRPFFVMEPCVSDRGTCTTGIDCCNGFCRDGLCQPPAVDKVCSNIDERCTTAADCCDGSASCIGGFCAIVIR